MFPHPSTQRLLRIKKVAHTGGRSLTHTGMQTCHSGQLCDNLRAQARWFSGDYGEQSPQTEKAQRGHCVRQRAQRARPQHKQSSSAEWGAWQEPGLGYFNPSSFPKNCTQGHPDMYILENEALLTASTALPGLHPWGQPTCWSHVSKSNPPTLAVTIQQRTEGGKTDSERAGL